jgi:beta-lactamase class A
MGGDSKPHKFLLEQTPAMDPFLQGKLEALDTNLRRRFDMAPEQTSAGVVDLSSPRLALLRPDLLMYGASVPKIAILLAFFHQHPEAAGHLTESTRRELGMMIKQSSNEMAAKFSKALGLATIRQVLEELHFYDASGPAGIWMGKHYGEATERVGDPIGDHSHAVTVRQVLRFYWLLERRELLSPQASDRMLEIFDSPGLPHDAIKFVKGLAGRSRALRRKWGSWENWLHDSAVVCGPGRHYILVGLTNHSRGDEYLAELAPAVDDWFLS